MATQDSGTCPWSSHAVRLFRPNVDGKVCKYTVYLCAVFSSNKYTAVGTNEPLL